MTKKNQDKLIKIDESIYNLMKGYVEKNKLEYPSMKHFVEKAIVKALGFKQYNIGGVRQDYDEDTPLKRIVGESQKEFTLCIICNRPFLKNTKSNNESSRICPNCKDTIVHFAPKLKKEKDNEK